jgi:hypothetical protein
MEGGEPKKGWNNSPIFSLMGRVNYHFLLHFLPHSSMAWNNFPLNGFWDNPLVVIIKSVNGNSGRRKSP